MQNIRNEKRGGDVSTEAIGGSGGRGKKRVKEKEGTGKEELQTNKI
jgi:hypothetical protein